MTAVTGDELALCNAIRQHPDEDLPRLLYADWLDEQGAVSVPCPKCLGGEVKFRRCLACQRVHWHMYCGCISSAEQKECDCPQCQGTGTVIDPTRSRRAELCRVSVARERRGLQRLERDKIRVTNDYRCTKCGALWHYLDGSPNQGWTLLSAKCGETCCDNLPMEANCIALTTDEVAILNRERELIRDLDATRPTCPRCHGRRCIEGERDTLDGTELVNETCSTCTGTGRVGTWERGAFSVKVDRFDRVWAHEFIRCEDACHFDNPKRPGWKNRRNCMTCGGTGQVWWWQLTPWALALRDAHPDVIEVWCEDRRPNATEYGLTWNRDTNHHASTDGVPAPVFDLMILDGVGDSYKCADAPDAARRALARAVAQSLFAGACRA